MGNEMTESNKDSVKAGSQAESAAESSTAAEAGIASGAVSAEKGNAAPAPENESKAAPSGKRDTTPGGMLRETREFMGLTIQDVTDRLKFRPEFISNLENNCFDSRTASTQLVRSWLIAYAKFLGIDRVMILDAFEKYHDGQKDGGRKEEAPAVRETPKEKKWKTVELERPARKAPEKKKDTEDAGDPAAAEEPGENGDAKGRTLKNIMMFLLILIVCICVTLILKVQNQGRQQANLRSAVETRVTELTSDEKPSAAGAGSTAVSGPEDTKVPAAGNPDSGENAAPANEAAAGKPAPQAQPAPEAAAPAADAEKNNAGSVKDTAGKAAPAAEKASSESAAKDSGAANKEASAEASADVSSGKADIAVSFSGPCWIEIQDAAGKRLISNTYGKGSSIKVSSEKLPLTVRIGMKANISEFTVNGKSIGVSSRFTVEK